MDGGRGGNENEHENGLKGREWGGKWSGSRDDNIEKGGEEREPGNLRSEKR